MRILSPDGAAALAELLLEDLPRVVLRLMTHSTSATEAEIIGAVSRRIPSSVPRESISRRTVSSIRWFVHAGDVASAGVSRYIILPPYAVLRSRRSSGGSLRIFGSPRMDEFIDKQAQRLGSRLEHELVQWHWEMGSSEAPSVGLKRKVRIKESDVTEMVSLLKKADIPVVDTMRFLERLPSLERVNLPPHSSYQALPPSWGMWDMHDSLASGSDRWTSIEHWDSIDAGLLRWRPTDDWRGERSTRIFYHSGLDLFAEMDTSSGRLLAFYLDRLAANVRSAWIKDSTVWVPAAIPDAHQHWMQLVSEDWNRRGDLREYRLASDPRLVRRGLQNTLGLIFVRGVPKEIEEAR